MYSLTAQIESVELGRIYYTPPDTQQDPGGGGMVQLQAGLHAEVWVTTKEKSMSVACVNIEVIDILAMVSKQATPSVYCLNSNIWSQCILLVSKILMASLDELSCPIELELFTLHVLAVLIAVI